MKQMRLKRPATRHLSNAGFTLVEMAMVIVILGLVMLAIFPALNAVRIANERAVTQSNLHSLMLATAAYAQANGCLPCPANASASTTAFGLLGYTSTTIACGTCSNPEGIPPFVALGIPASTARDGWGHWITMRVDPALTVLPTNPANCGTTATCSTFIPPAAPCVAADVQNNFCSLAGISGKGLCASGLSKTNRIHVTLAGGATQQAAVIFVSHGTSGYGSYFAQPALSGINGYRLPFTSNYATCSPLGGYAECNAANKIQFVDAPMRTGDTDPYDDILAYADRNTLVSMLGNGSCQTVW